MYWEWSRYKLYEAKGDEAEKNFYLNERNLRNIWWKFIPSEVRSLFFEKDIKYGPLEVYSWVSIIKPETSHTPPPPSTIQKSTFFFIQFKCLHDGGNSSPPEIIF